MPDSENKSEIYLEMPIPQFLMQMPQYIPLIASHIDITNEDYVVRYQIHEHGNSAIEINHKNSQSWHIGNPHNPVSATTNSNETPLLEANNTYAISPHAFGELMNAFQKKTKKAKVLLYCLFGNLLKNALIWHTVYRMKCSKTIRLLYVYINIKMAYVPLQVMSMKLTKTGVK